MKPGPRVCFTKQFREIFLLNLYGKNPPELLVSVGHLVPCMIKSLMAKWLEQTSQWHEKYCHNLEVMSSNPGQVKLGVRSTSVLSCTWTKNSFAMLANHRIRHWGTCTVDCQSWDCRWPFKDSTSSRICVSRYGLTLKVLNFWKFTCYCSLKPLWSGMGEVVLVRTSPTLHPPSSPTVHQLSWLAL